MASFFSRKKVPDSAAQSYLSSSVYEGAQPQQSPRQQPQQQSLQQQQQQQQQQFAIQQNVARLNPRPSTSSSRTTVDDPVLMHLLMETAMHDSSGYTVLEPQEVDGLKKQLEMSQSRIEAAERRLAMENKARDAAMSLMKLDQQDDIDEQGEGVVDAIRRCDELNRELREMDKEYQRLQKRLLEHTAGVLQMTHKGYTKDMSVASLTTGSSLPDEDFEDFDMNSGLYKPYAGGFEDGIIDIFGGSNTNAGGSMTEEQRQIIEHVEAKVEQLNYEMTELMARLDQRAQPPAQARTLQDDPENPIEVLQEQVGMLEQSVASMQEIQARQVHLINRQIYEAITGDSSGLASPSYSAPSQNDDLPNQLSYTANGIGKLKHMVNHMGQTVSNSGQKMEDLDQYDTVLRGLWDLIIADPLGTPRLGGEGSFSLQAFNAKVQAIHARVGSLEQQKEVLTRQIQQQRELNASSDEVKDKKIADMSEQLRRLPEAEATSSALEAELAQFKANAVQLETEVERLKAGDPQSQAEIARLKAEAPRLEAEVARLQADAAQLRQQTSHFQGEAARLPDVQAAQEHLEGEVARLQTELTMARAELDGAYGTRAQRKAEAAADPALTARVGTLEQELAEMAADYESMTKSTIEYEKEREALETTVDGLRNKVDELEAALSESRIGLMGGGLGLGNKTPATPATEASGRAGTSAGVLKAEFRKMMKETKAEHAKRLREEQDERRKLEATIRSMRNERTGRAAARVVA